ncbi:hypothetical protein BKA62DRAFT_774265 [Auriculariales sp. MPI-PUGE-AT-0066]|nr:hypothetical protein BKA62DRAFT_774265 [Auriculariales sp. MPI-PUGE-AT-0066]
MAPSDGRASEGSSNEKREDAAPAPAPAPASAPAPKQRKRNPLRGVLAFVCSTKMIPVAKGTLSFTIALILIMLHGFDKLVPFPPALASMIILTIAGNVGGTIGVSSIALMRVGYTSHAGPGATIQAVFLAMVGVTIGGLGFYILAHLNDSHVAQGFILFIFVYFAAIIKAQGQKWFGLSLFAVLMAFNGIYTSVLLGGYSADYLISYLEAYALGAAIVLFVNIVVWPTSAEKELRRTLVLSLEHVGTLSHLLSKTYTMTITEDEKKVRDHLALSLRADFGFLTQKIQDTMIEVNFSQYSMRDYSEFVLRTRALQLAAISAHSSLVGVDHKDTDLFKQYFLPNTTEPFLVFRRCVENTLKEISSALQCKPLNNAKAQPEYRQYMDVEAQQPNRSSESVTETVAPGLESEDPEALSEQMQRAEQDVELQLAIVSKRLEHEVRHTDDSTVQSPVDGRSIAAPETPRAFTADDVEAICKKTKEGLTCHCGVEKMMPMWNNFALTQQRILSELLSTGMLHGRDDKMRMQMPQPSVQATWSGARTPREGVNQRVSRRHPPSGTGAGAGESLATPISPRSHAPSIIETALGEDEDDLEGTKMAEDDAETEANHHSLLRVYTFIFAMRIYVQQLEWYHQAAVKFRPDSDNKKHPSRRLQVHFFQQLHNPWGKAVKALKLTPPSARSEGDESTTTLPNTEQELSFKEAMALLENRTYTAAGALVFAMLLFAASTRAFFINYALTSGVLTLIVSISPTLGQSLLTFVLQVAGSGIGYLWGVALLEMFRDVGGYKFNPYGMVALLSASSLPLFYFIYYNPKFFVFSLLALNRKSITALGIALGIAVIFQVFILRNPARRTLRKKLADLTFSMLSYYTLFHAWAGAIIPYHTDDLALRPPAAAIKRVNDELQKREIKMQQDIIDLMPLLVFAGAERDFGPPFRADLAGKVIKSLQIMLDRMKEARFTIGTTKVPNIITREFSQRLSPYRRRNIQLAKSALHLCASSLASKAPLPGATMSHMYLQGSIADNLHDALLISSHLARTPEGKECILNGELTRYFAYVMTVTNMSDQLLALEDACHDLFGDIDSKLA